MKDNKFMAVLILFLLIFTATVNGQEATPADVTINRDGYHLKGKLYQAPGETMMPTVILLQGSPGNTTDVLGLGKKLSQSGINAMTFNYSGTHQSEGKLSFPDCLKDIGAVYEFLFDTVNIRKFRIDTSMIVLAGYSFGGGVAMTYAIQHPEIKRIISIAGNDWGQWFADYIQNPEMKKSADAGIQKSIEAGIIRFEPGCTPWEIAEAGIDRLYPDLFLRKNAPRLADRDLLIIGGWDDISVSLERYLIPLYRALKSNNAQNIEIVAFQDDHTFSKSRDRLAHTIAEWIQSVSERNIK
jgi:pimeloyl-ACP methyl ester carboxylesterase